MKIGRPLPDEHNPRFAGYISRVPETDVVAALAAQRDELAARLAAIPEEREGFRYAEGKRSIREVVGHLADTERVLGDRAVCIARGEEAPLPGFDENTYAANSGHDECRLPDLAEELLSLRASHLLLLRHVPDAAWTRRGTVNGHPATPRAMAYVMDGHVRHHLAVLAERYGLG